MRKSPLSSNQAKGISRCLFLVPKLPEIIQVIGVRPDRIARIPASRRIRWRVSRLGLLPCGPLFSDLAFLLQYVANLLRYGEFGDTRGFRRVARQVVEDFGPVLALRCRGEGRFRQVPLA